MGTWLASWSWWLDRLHFFVQIGWYPQASSGICQWHSAAPESLELDHLYWVYFFVHECARCMLDDVWWRLAVVWMIYDLSLETNLCSSDAQAHPGHIHKSDRQDAKREYMYGIQAALNRSPWFHIVWFGQCNLQENGACRYIHRLWTLGQRLLALLGAPWMWKMVLDSLWACSLIQHSASCWSSLVKNAGYVLLMK